MVPHASLVDLRKGDAAILDRIDLPTEDARRLMELGFVPGTLITAGFSAPGGDPEETERRPSPRRDRHEHAGRNRRRVLREDGEPQERTGRDLEAALAVR